MTGPSVLQDTGTEPDERLSATRQDHQERLQWSWEQEVHWDNPTLERAAAEGSLEEDRMPEGRPEKEREARTGSEVEQAPEATVRGPGGYQAPEEEEEEEGQEDSREEVENLPQEEVDNRRQQEGRGCHWAQEASTSLPSLCPR